jgi:RNA polymerase sigma factor (TIGR02999 family)
VPDTQVTVLLRRLHDGDKAVMDELVPLVYAELHRMAASYLRREHRDHTLQSTGLVHEAYLRMVGQEQPDFQSRSHFFGIASRVMRQILVDHARSRHAAKRGGDTPKVSLEEAIERIEDRPGVMIAIDDALNALGKRDPEKLRLVELRFFGGMTAEESAEMLGLPVQTVRSQLRVAQAWLRREVDRQSE